MDPMARTVADLDAETAEDMAAVIQLMSALPADVTTDLLGKRFDPRQLRDENGMWTGHGGGHRKPRAPRSGPPSMGRQVTQATVTAAATTAAATLARVGVHAALRHYGIPV